MPLPFTAAEPHVYRLTALQIAQKYGITVRAIRWYQQLGLVRFLQAGKVLLVSEENQTKLELVLKYKRYGFTLKEIEHLIDGSNPITPALKAQLICLEKRRVEVSAAIDELQAHLLRLS
jgi:DNA-binding transcriptional MerR regulator